MGDHWFATSWTQRVIEVTQRRPEISGPPEGWLRLLLRLPVALYRIRLGFLLGRRFLLLEHRGRSTGRIRRTVLEVVARHPETLYVAAAWGEKAQWLKNIRIEPRVRVHTGFEHLDMVARVVDTETARQILDDYAIKHPRAFRNLARLILTQPGETTQESVERAAAALPMVELARS